MLGMDLEIACHRLAIDLTIKLVQQKKRCHGQEQSIVINVEVEK